MVETRNVMVTLPVFVHNYLRDKAVLDLRSTRSYIRKLLTDIASGELKYNTQHEDEQVPPPHAVDSATSFGSFDAFIDRKLKE